MSKELSQQRFSQFAERYVASTTHAKGAELARLVEIAQPKPGWLALDLATGGGHTARTFAPLVRHMIAADISTAMLNAARGHLIDNEITTAGYTATDAEHLAFASNTFDLVTCRIAAHHFPDQFRFVQECARVLRPGGTLLIQDQVAPPEERDADYVDAFERLRDPSHGRTYAEVDWRGMYLDSDLTVEHVEYAATTAKLVSWAQTQDCDEHTIERLQILLVQAPDAVKAFWQPRCAGTPDAEFNHVYIIIAGRKKGG